MFLGREPTGVLTGVAGVESGETSPEDEMLAGDADSMGESRVDFEA